MLLQEGSVHSQSLMFGLGPALMVGGQAALGKVLFFMALFCCSLVLSCGPIVGAAVLLSVPSPLVWLFSHGNKSSCPRSCRMAVSELDIVGYFQLGDIVLLFLPSAVCILSAIFDFMDYRWVSKAYREVHVGIILCLLHGGDAFIVWALPFPPFCLVGAGALVAHCRCYIGFFPQGLHSLVWHRR